MGTGTLPAGRWVARASLTLALATGVCAAALSYLVATPGAATTWIVTSWLASIALVLAATRPDIRGALRRPSAPSTQAILPWLGLTLIAALPRLLARDRFPTVMDSDEGAFALIARAARDGTLPNPFGTGFFSAPHVYPIVEGWLAGPLGPDTGDYRALSGMVGVIGVLATWRLGTRLVGPAVAMAGAVVLAAMPLHLYLSRTTLNNVTDPAALMLALLFLYRATRNHHGANAALAGLALGLGFYGYYGGRALPAVVLLVLVALVVARQVRATLALRIAGWMVMAFLLTAMPLIVYYVRVPSEFGGHVDQVSQLPPALMREDPVAYLRVYVPNLRDALLYPLAGNELGFWRQPPPFLGWPTAALLMIGVGVGLARLVRARQVELVAYLVLPWVVLSAGIAVTVPIASQRLIVLTPLFALAAGTGLVAVARGLAAALQRCSPRIEALLTWTMLLALTVGHIAWFASEDRQLANYLDRRTLIAWDIGWRTSQPVPDGDAPPPILFAGPPYMFTGGFNNLTWLVPNLVMSDVPDPIASEPPLELPEGTVLVIIEERAVERCAAEAALPGLRVAEVRSRDGALLYIAIYREPLVGWSMLRSPAGSTFDVAVTSPCQRAQGSSPAS